VLPRDELAATIDELHETLEMKAKSTAKIGAVVAAAALVGLVALAVWRRRH
jgi:MYXO-CTERM domain-containing protein